MSIKRLVALTALALLTQTAGGMSAGSYTVTDFDDGADNHSGYQYIFYGGGNSDAGNPEKSLVTSAGPAINYGAMSYVAGKVAPTNGCYGGSAYCAALKVSSLPQYDELRMVNSYQPDDGYYPSFGFVIPLAGDNVNGWADFAKVDSVVFYAKTESPGVTVMFKIGTYENSINGPHSAGERPDYPGINKTNEHSNLYMVTFNPTAAWTRFAFAVKPVIPASNSGYPITTVTTTGQAGDLKQAGWYGTAFTFNPANVRCFDWGILSDYNDNLIGKAASVFIDNVQLVGAQIDEDFQIYPPGRLAITFNANGGTVTPTSGITDTDGKLATLPAPTRTGYTFNGWYTASAGGTPVTDDRVYSASATIYAQWTLITYTITFDANGGTVTPVSGTTGVGGTLASLPVPAKTGYDFNGWYTAETGGVRVTTGTAFGASITVYAQWTPVYTITFDANGGAVTPASGATGADGTLASLPVPTRTDYAFNGWYTAETGGVRVTTGTAFGTSITVYAQWMPVYIVTFDANGGAVTPASGTTGAGGTLASLPVPTRTGYTFNGWYTAAADGVQVTTGTVFSASITVYAQWTLTIHTITFNANGGTVTPESAATGAGGTLTLTELPTPHRQGYTFDGWYSAPTGGGIVTLSAQFTSNATVYARWTLIAVTGITGVPDTVEAGRAYTLSGTVVPEDAPNRTIAWTVAIAGSTGAVISGDLLLASATGDIVVKAVIRDGKATGVNYEQTFTITITNSVSIASPAHVIPPPPPKEEATVIAPVIQLSGEFTAGPNPISKTSGIVNFYRQGRRITNCELRIYDATGNVINKVKIKDNAVGNQSRRIVGKWDLTDKKGRQVSEGTYLVKGVIKTSDGKSEKVSVILGVR